MLMREAAAGGHILPMQFDSIIIRALHCGAFNLLIRRASPRVPPERLYGMHSACVPILFAPETREQKPAAAILVRPPRGRRSIAVTTGDRRCNAIQRVWGLRVLRGAVYPSAPALLRDHEPTKRVADQLQCPERQATPGQATATAHRCRTFQTHRLHSRLCGTGGGSGGLRCHNCPIPSRLLPLARRSG